MTKSDKKKAMLINAGYREIPAYVYFNSNTHTIVTHDAVEDRPIKWIEAVISAPNQTGKWYIFSKTPLHHSIEQEMIETIKILS